MELEELSSLDPCGRADIWRWGRNSRRRIFSRSCGTFLTTLDKKGSLICPQRLKIQSVLDD
ncbi:mCG147939 [Mus musculus]|nr:mCG147939 [Mus musculus]